MIAKKEHDQTSYKTVVVIIQKKCLADIQDQDLENWATQPQKEFPGGTPAPSPSGNQNASRMVIIDLELHVASFKSS